MFVASANILKASTNFMLWGSAGKKNPMILVRKNGCHQILYLEVQHSVLAFFSRGVKCLSHLPVSPTQLIFGGFIIKREA